MANSTRSSRKTIEENSKGRRSGGGGSNSSLSIEASGLRRSTRDTSCPKTTTPKKSISQQLGHTDKQVATSPVTRSLAKKVTTSSSLRRSKRCNKQSPTLKSSGSKVEISSRNNKKRKVERREKTLKQLTFGTMVATENANEECDSRQVKRIRMTACSYKALFRKQEKKVKVSGKYEDLASPSKSPAKGGSNPGGCLSKEGTAAVEAGNVTATNSLPGKETAEIFYEEKSTQINQTNTAGEDVIRDTDNVDESVNHKIHNLPLLSVPELVGSNRNDNGSNALDVCIVAQLPEVGNHGTKEKCNDDIYEESVIEGRADATAMAVCKDSTSVASSSCQQENNVGESTAMHMSRKSGEPEVGVDVRLDENNIQMSVQKSKIQGNDAVADVEQLPGCSAFGCRADSSQFMEYWVPTQLSHVQLEKYCSVLLSSSLTLCSSLKSDIFGALGDVLADTRKCCDHPYLLDKDKDYSLDSFLTSLEPIQMLDIGIQASGKLDLLVKFLVEMRRRGMRTLILFQSISNFGKDPKSSGDILDDVMRQRFGVDSYERVDAGLVRAKVQTALKNFNDKELGRFVFLLEARACRPSIKLLSIDVVIIFTSDLNPANDIRNLQKLTLDSECEKIKVLRLYSCFTVEETVLINAKQRIGMDGRLEEINLLLRWGASYLFDRLKEFHCSNDESSKLIISDPLDSNDVMKEFISMLSVVGENNIKNSSMIVRVQQNAGVYSTECPLVGESKNHLSMEKLPHIFWAELLEGKYPCWRYLSNSGQRNRKRLQNSSDLHVEQGDNSDETGKKRIKLATDNGVHTKLANDNGLQSSRKRGREGGMTASSNKEAARSDPSPPENGASNSMDECDEARKRLNAQRSLLGILQPEVSRLCEVVNLTDDVKQKANIFLDYVVNNHRVDREPESILQAFQLALCWTAASMSKVKINHKESFELAKNRLSYCCEWDQADYVYKMMRCLKEMFLNKRQGSEAKDYQTPKSNISQSAIFSTVNRQVDVVGISLVQGHSNNSDVSGLNKLVGKSMSRSIKKINDKSCKRMAKLLLLQEKERNKICSTYEEAKANLDKQHLIEAAVIRSLHGEGPTRIDRLNALESEYNKRAEDHKNQMLASLSELERAHIAAKTALQMKEASQIKKLTERIRTELLKKPAEATGEGEICFSDSESPDIIELSSVRVSAAPQESPSEARAPEEAPDAAGAPEDAPNEARAPEEAPDATVAPQEAPGAPVAVISSEDPFNPVMRFRLSSKSNDVSLLVPVVTGLLEHVGASRLDREDVSVGPWPSESTSDGATSSLPGDEISLKEHHTTSALAVDIADQVNLPPHERVVPSETSHLPSREYVSVGPWPSESTPDGATSSLPGDEISLKEHHTTSALAIDNADQVNLPPHERVAPSEKSHLPSREDVSVGPWPSESTPDGATSSLPGDEISLKEHHTTSALAVDNADQVNLPPHERVVPSETSHLPSREDVSVGPWPSESTPDGATSLFPGDEISLKEHHTTSALAVDNADQVNLPPQERDVPSEASHLPSREGPSNKETISRVPDHAVPVDAHYEDMQIDRHIEGTVATHEETCNVLEREAAKDIGSIDLQTPQDFTEDLRSRLSNISLCSNRPISEASQLNVRVLDATSVVEQDISGNPNQQESRPERCGNSTLPQLVDISPHDDSVLPSLLEEFQNQSNVRSTPSRTHEGNASSIVQLNAPALVSEPLVSSTTNDGQAQPDQPVPNAAQTEQILDMQNIPDLAPVSGTAQPPSTNGHTSLNVPELRQVHEPLEASRSLSRAVQCTTNTHVTSVPTNSTASGSGIGSIQPAFRMPSGKSDPLQIELDKIRQQMDHSIKNFEETKKQLEVDCQKEIAEAAAKIRQKFVVKIQESEAEYVSKKKELETNLNKVMMNKVLAAAFRYKCMDVKKSGTPGTVRSDVLNSLQPWIASAASVRRPSSLSSMHASAAAATSNSQSITPPTAVVLPRAPSPARPPPLVKTLHHSSLRSPSPRPPLPSQGQREVVQRAPAPHLQSASRPSHGVSPHFIPPPSWYRPQTSSVPHAHFPKPTAVTQTGPPSTVANRINQVDSRISHTPNSLNRHHFVANLPNASQSSNFRLPPVNTTTTTSAPNFSEVRQLRDISNGSAIIDVANIIELSDEE